MVADGEGRMLALLDDRDGEAEHGVADVDGGLVAVRVSHQNAVEGFERGQDVPDEHLSLTRDGHRGLHDLEIARLRISVGPCRQDDLAVHRLGHGVVPLVVDSLRESDLRQSAVDVEIGAVDETALR
nr:hypothetical protein [Prauserella cavernicola]